MSEKKEFERAASGVVTKAERDNLIAARPRPRVELHLTPNGHEVVRLHNDLRIEHEERLRHLEERLKQARQTFKKGHRLALLRGRARHDFDRGR